jgi:hypothetical protein
MANSQSICSTFKRDLLNGLHAFGTTVVRGSTTKDSFKGALYLASATVNAATTAYSATGEVSGSGYTAGGTAVTNANVPTLTGTTAHWTPSAALSWTTVTLATAFDAVLIYNDTAAGKNAVGVFTFGSNTVSAGNFSVTMPVDSDTTGLLRIA